MKKIGYILTIFMVAFSMAAFSIAAIAQKGAAVSGAPRVAGPGAAPTGPGSEIYRKPSYGGGGGGGIESRFDRINKEINLTAAQQVKIKAELQKTDEEFWRLSQDYPVWNAEAQAAVNKMWASETARMLKVLNDAQKPKYQAWIHAWLEEKSKKSN